MAFHLPLQFASASFGLLFGNFADGSRWMYLGSHHCFAVLFSSPWVSFFFFLIAFFFIIVWVSIHLSWAQDRPAFGTGNGKWCKIFLYTTSNTVLLRWSGLGWLGLGHGMRCCCALSRMNCMRWARILCVYWCFSYYWNSYLIVKLVHLVNIPFNLPCTQKATCSLKDIKHSAMLHAFGSRIPDEIHAQHTEPQLHINQNCLDSAFVLRL
ncbi:hypothetical protein L211DRAFT_610995 [Terfezia boudieri ATCC MYA-4762]|uniref:Uncharacterized protein n=1 Tax=Terfezia boudieri ATCC MYA-4762 TaxID=1051890 RepID=A0A3N4LZZ4_9PEZI|nr:hypothetical protein L211DRAFT_610995 [Terfezia boudieri ATCC MYA-4762]